VVGVNGQIVKQGSHQFVNGANKIAIDTENWRTGYYFIRVTAADGKTHTAKFLKN
jgi:hypothetical protein